MPREQARCRSRARAPATTRAPCRRGERLRAVGAAVVGDHHLAVDAAARQGMRAPCRCSTARVRASLRQGIRMVSSSGGAAASWSMRRRRRVVGVSKPWIGAATESEPGVMGILRRLPTDLYAVAGWCHARVYGLLSVDRSRGRPNGLVPRTMVLVLIEEPGRRLRSPRTHFAPLRSRGSASRDAPSPGAGGQRGATVITGLSDDRTSDELPDISER